MLMGGGNRAWAADVTQDVFIRLMEDVAKLDTSKPLIGWLLTVACRLCIDRLRRERSWTSIVQHWLSTTPELVEPSEQTPRDDEALLRQLNASFDTLPPKERAAMVLKYCEGLRQTEIARTLGCSEGYVSKLLARAVTRLRELGWETDDV